MKNVKLFLSSVVVFLMLGTSVVNAQQKQSVIISETNYPKITIEVIKPDYSVEQKEYSKKEENAFSVLKKELDKWRDQGFEVIESSMSTTGNNFYTIVYFLAKKD